MLAGRWGRGESGCPGLYDRRLVDVDIHVFVEEDIHVTGLDGDYIEVLGRGRFVVRQNSSSCVRGPPVYVDRRNKLLGTVLLGTAAMVRYVAMVV